MDVAKLSTSQEQILTTLVNEHQQSDGPVKASQIATVLDRTPGGVRNAMQGLKLLDLVEGVPGPAGGYEPTEHAFTVLERDGLENRETVTVARDYERIDVTVDEIDLTNVGHPSECNAHVHFQQSEPDIEVGDPVIIGPTPLSELAVVGRVGAVNDTADEILVEVARMEAPLGEE